MLDERGKGVQMQMLKGPFPGMQKQDKSTSSPVLQA